MPGVFLDPSRRPRRRRRRWPLVALAVVLLGAGAALGAYFAFVKPPDNVSNPDVEFTEAAPVKQPRKRAETFKWPFYGYTADRNRYLDASIAPPYSQVWRWKTSSLIEFQPILVNGVLYVVPNDGNARAIDAKTGKVKWRRKVGTLNASSPAWEDGRLFITTLSGRITSLDAKTGRRRWKRNLGSRSESSPVVIDGRVYFGSEDGTVYALRAGDGRRLWTYHAGGAVKAGLAYAEGILYFGDYSGTMTAIRARDGSKVWSTATSGRVFQQSGQFYSTPAVANGRVYVGNTDHFVYSFAAHTGQLAWRYSTGSYVYAAPAVAPGPGGKPTVFIGSYDSTFYAFDARSGNVRWRYDAPGRISGAPTVIGKIVYFSDLDSRSTTGLDVRTGKRVFKMHSGKFNPVISDGKRIYLTGYGTEYGLVRRKDARKARKAVKAAERKR
ncbi:MAG TPA: PQQ-binding-like beta-propeller repeat protein [Thermoleophilaceae bacterium]|jgi:outer membrane protein assembly factor BamB